MIYFTDLFIFKGILVLNINFHVVTLFIQKGGLLQKEVDLYLKTLGSVEMKLGSNVHWGRSYPMTYIQVYTKKRWFVQKRGCHLIKGRIELLCTILCISQHSHIELS